MTLKGALAQGTLAVGALLAAYIVSQKPATQSSGDVKVLDLAKRSLTRVRYEKAASWAEVSPAEEAGEDAAWIKVSSRSLPGRPASPDGGVAEPGPSFPERELRGSKQAVELLNRFTPLYATRTLGVLTPEKAKELGLDETTRKLTVVTRDGPEVFDVSVAGSMGAPYVRRQRDGQTFILGGAIVSDLESLVDTGPPTGRLVERQLHAFKVEPEDVIAVEQGGKTRELVALPGDVPQTIRLVPQNDRATTDVFAKNWHDKLWRLPAQDLLGKGETPAVGAPKVELRIRYQRGKKDLGFLELGPVGREVFGRTEHTAGWVKLPPMAEESLLEATKIVAGPAAP